jgi:hypothetical protein
MRRLFSCLVCFTMGDIVLFGIVAQVPLVSYLTGLQRDTA